MEADIVVMKDGDHYQVEGCGKQALAGRKGKWVLTDHDIRSRTTFDLDCRKDALVYQYLDLSERGVSGCGRRATYVWRYGGGWLMNTASVEEQ